MGNVYTFETVPTEVPPEYTAESASLVVDCQRTFMDVPENSGDRAELPVAGTVAALPAMQSEVAIANAAGALMVATLDTHTAGKNPTVVTSFVGLKRETWVTPEMVDQWTDDDHPIRPDAGFTLDMYKGYIHFLAEERGVPGAMIWGGHSDPDSPLYWIHPALFGIMSKNPNLQIIRKGQNRSLRLPGIYPESYSADEMATGESLGLYELLEARGITRVYFSAYIAGDFCGGSTAFNLAKKGLEVWMCVDAQGSVILPNYAGTNLTSENLMLNQLIGADVHFYRSADNAQVHAHLLKNVRRS